MLERFEDGRFDLISARAPSVQSRPFDQHKIRVVPEPVEETGNLIDLMAALEASVNATKAARGDTPVSVADAKKARAGRSAEADEKPAAKKTAARRSGKAPDADEAEEPAAAAGGRSRRRKSA